MFPERESFGGEAARISSKRLPVLRTTSQQSLKSSRYSSKEQMSSVEFVFFLFLLVRLFDLLKACEIFRHFLQSSQSRPNSMPFSGVYPAVLTSFYWLPQVSAKFGQG